MPLRVACHPVMPTMLPQRRASAATRPFTVSNRFITR
jgi:hypothetical protein